MGSNLPEILQRMDKLIKQAQIAQHIKDKERQINKYQRATMDQQWQSTDMLSCRRKHDSGIIQSNTEKWENNLSGSLLNPSRMPKPRHCGTPTCPVVDIITATETFIHKKCISVEKTEHFCLCVHVQSQSTSLFT